MWSTTIATTTVSQKLTIPTLLKTICWKFVTDSPILIFVKYLLVAFNVFTWKWFYYAPNTYKEFKLAKWRKEGKEIPEGVVPSDVVTIRALMSWGTPFYSFWEFFSVVIGPYLLIHFFLFPLPYLAVGEYLGTGHEMYWSAVKNLFYADALTNAHAFVAIATNHAGDDMYRFRQGCRPYSGSFFLRQVLASQSTSGPARTSMTSCTVTSTTK